MRAVYATELKNYNFTFNLSKDPAIGAGGSLNAIVRFLRCRPGDQFADYGEDAIGGRYFKDAIIDHITAGWSVDETLTFYGVQNFTAALYSGQTYHCCANTHAYILHIVLRQARSNRQTPLPLSRHGF